MYLERFLLEIKLINGMFTNPVKLILSSSNVNKLNSYNWNWNEVEVYIYWTSILAQNYIDLNWENIKNVFRNFDLWIWRNMTFLPNFLLMNFPLRECFNILRHMSVYISLFCLERFFHLIHSSYFLYIKKNLLWSNWKYNSS